MATIREIVFDCAHPAKLARFWAAALDGYRVRAYDDAEVARLASIGRTPETDPTVMLDGPGPLLCFQEQKPARIGRGRVHLDIEVGDPQQVIARLCSLGGRIERVADGYTVLEDPEGNRFCVVGRRYT
jgi:hypothetical protein